MLHHVPADGGALAVEVHAGSSAPVLALHGVSSNRRLWNWVRAQAPDLSLVTPDLRGRADSAGLPGPYSLRRHTEDLVRVLDVLGIASVSVCGMSMGGWVAVDLAVTHPDRVRDLVLVDGGFPMPMHRELTREQVPAAFAPLLTLLDRTWPDTAAYVAVQTAANSLLSADDPLLHDYFGHFLADGRIRLNREALMADAADVFFGESRWRELTVPTRFVYAEWSTGPDTPPAYTPSQAEDFHRTLGMAAPPRRVLGVDHGGLVMTAPGAAAVAEVLAG